MTLNTQVWTRTHTLILSGFMLLMVMTRIHHFGAITSLPDASLAVFFFAGLYLRNRLVFPLLMVEAAVIDYFVINVGGVSDWCVSPAYLFLIPTYAVMWEAGRFSADKLTYSVQKLGQLFLTIVLATTVAFIISNWSFYAFSGKFETMSFVSYVSETAKYFSSYLSTTLAYSLILTLLHLAVVQYQGKDDIKA